MHGLMFKSAALALGLMVGELPVTLDGVFHHHSDLIVLGVLGPVLAAVVYAVATTLALGGARLMQHLRHAWSHPCKS
jgi:hypothetical protein